MNLPAPWRPAGADPGVRRARAAVVASRRTRTATRTTSRFERASGTRAWSLVAAGARKGRSAARATRHGAGLVLAFTRRWLWRIGATLLVVAALLAVAGGALAGVARATSDQIVVAAAGVAALGFVAAVASLPAPLRSGADADLD